MIGGQAPSAYLAQLQTHTQVQLADGEMDAILRSHVMDPSLLRVDSFEAFYSARKAALLGLVGRAMGKAPTAPTTNVSDDDEDEDIE